MALYKTVGSHIEPFLADAEVAGKGIPAYVREELYEFLNCGVLAHGFLRVACEDCLFLRDGHVWQYADAINKLSCGLICRRVEGCIRNINGKAMGTMINMRRFGTA